MITMPDLQTALLDLLHEVRDTDIKVIIGGGFGIYLKTEHVRRQHARTLFYEWPEARSTLDLDLFLWPELLIQKGTLKPLAGALTSLGYEVVPGAEKYQFVKPGPSGDKSSYVKIDILTGPRSRFENTDVRVDNRRARPNPSVGIHAHPVVMPRSDEVGNVNWMDRTIRPGGDGAIALDGESTPRTRERSREWRRGTPMPIPCDCARPAASLRHRQSSGVTSPWREAIPRGKRLGARDNGSARSYDKRNHITRRLNEKANRKAVNYEVIRPLDNLSTPSSLRSDELVG